MQVQYKLAVMVHQCMQNTAPRYLVDCCTAVADVPLVEYLTASEY